METWLLLRSGAAPAALNMAVDETLLQRVHYLGKPVLRFYSWAEPAASFGYFQRYDEVSRVTALRPLVRRPTGGGIVPHDSDWTYSLVFPPDHAWYALKAIESYRRVHEWVRAAFEAFGTHARLASGRGAATPVASASVGQCFIAAEQFDVLVGPQKIAGAAQRRTRGGLLIQGSIQPQSQMIRSAWEHAFCHWAAEQWEIQWASWDLQGDFVQHVRYLAEAKYSCASYNERR